jgi:sensor histidine kinase YesM
MVDEAGVALVSAPMSPVPQPMQSSGRTNRMLLLVFGTGAAIGLHLGLLHLLLLRSRLAIVPFVSGSLVFSSAVYALWRWVFPRLGGRTLLGQLVRQGAVTLVVLLVLSLVSVEIVLVLTNAPSLFGTPVGVERHIIITPEMRQAAARVYVFLPIVPTLLLTLIGYHQSWSRVRALESRERQLTELAATAQLAALRAQINPHFLFNSLNSIAQLIHTDPDKAEACVERLAEIFRYILRRAEKEFVPLADELHMAQAYLEIERARFGDRLQVQTNIDPRSLQQTIPNLILQPLVENAVKHGLSLKMGMGTIGIDAHVADGLLMLTVRDDGLGMPLAMLDHVYERGVGLRNLRDRLQRLYGDAHLPEISSAPGGGTEVRLRLPLRPAEAA